MASPRSDCAMYDAEFWNRRYAGDDYVYGTEPNALLAHHYGLLRSPVLSLSEGEGRNAVFLASHGLEVVCVDISSVALDKARKLARSRGVDRAEATTTLPSPVDSDPRQRPDERDSPKAARCP